MTNSQIEPAIRSGAPITLRMADGQESPVPHPGSISLSPRGTFVTVVLRVFVSWWCIPIIP